MPPVLVTDFDGTITERDFYQLVIDHAPAADCWGEYLSGRLTHFEAMRAILAHAPTDEATLAGMLAETRPDPQLGAAAAALRRAGWELVVASAGCAWYIERILRAAGVRAEVHANPGRIEPGRGLAMELPRASRFFSAQTGIDKEAVVRDALARSGRVAFAGDGPPDLAPALLVEGGLRFARGWLAGELVRRGLAFQPFRRWSEIAAALLG